MYKKINYTLWNYLTVVWSVHSKNKKLPWNKTIADDDEYVLIQKIKFKIKYQHFKKIISLKIAKSVYLLIYIYL